MVVTTSVFARLMLAALPLAMPIASRAQSATVTVAHFDPDGIVAPGEIVQFEMRVQWTTAFQVLSVYGGVVASGDRGLAANLNGPSPSGLWLPAASSLGTSSGGSIVGIDLEFVPYIFLGGGSAPPCVSYLSAGASGYFMSWTWTAPLLSSPLSVDFDFAPAPGTTGLWATENAASPIGMPLPAAYQGARLLVIPSPATLPIVLAAASMIARRRSH